MRSKLPKLTEVLGLPEAYRTTIPEQFLDDMRHMNVMWYTHLFGFGTAGVMQRVGIARDRIAEQGLGLFALEQHARYFSEVRVGQTIAIHTRFLGRSGKRFHVLHFMVNLDKEDISASFEAVSAFVDLQQRRQTFMTPPVAEAFDRWIVEHQALAWQPPVCGTMSA